MCVLHTLVAAAIVACMCAQEAVCVEEEWVACGHLYLPHSHRPVVDADISELLFRVEPRENGFELKCSSWHVWQECMDPPRTLVEISFRLVSYKDQGVLPTDPAEYVRVPIIPPCFVVVCQPNPALPFPVSMRSTVYAKGGGAKDVAAILPEADGSHVNISINSRNKMLLAESEEYSVKVMSPIVFSSSMDSPQNTDEAFIQQTLPLDIQTCTKVTNSNSLDKSNLSLLHWSKYARHVRDFSKAKILFKDSNDVSSHMGLSLGGVSPIRLRRQANNAPCFESFYNHAQFTENNEVGQVVATVSATDSDPGINGQVSYSLIFENDRDQSLFHIDSQTGIITAQARLNYEMSSSYTFDVMAEDGGGLSRRAVFVVDIIDLNDNAPTFQQGSYFNEVVSEDSEVGETVVDLSVIDEDSGSNGMIMYQLYNNTGDTFNVVSLGREARLTLFKRLDYETLTSYHVTLTARDEGNPTMSSSVIINIHVLDVADTLPVFNATSYFVSAPENLSIFSHILTVGAISLDSPPLAGIRYLIVQGNVERVFVLDENTGILTLIKALDYERTIVYTLEVQAQSIVNPSLRTPINVFVQVINTNEHTPDFTRMQYSVSVLESVPVSALVVTMAAEDLDNGVFGNVMYGFQANTGQGVRDTFEIDAVSGAITTLALLDKEAQDMYAFTVVASDGADPPLSSTVRVLILVTDVNDERPTFPQSVYMASVAENMGTGVEVIQVTASDSDSPTIEYFIKSGNHGNKFMIGIADGVILTRGDLNREERSLYTLDVIATDDMFESDSVTILVSIVDVNDEYPEFTSGQYTSLPLSESVPLGTELLRVQAIDRDAGDNGRVTYSLQTADMASIFRMDPNTGSLTLSRPLDYESDQFYALTILATDGGESPLISTAMVDIIVRDENDNAPVFERRETIVSLQENLPSSTSVIQLSATDEDSGSNSVLEYSIVRDSVAIQNFDVFQSGLVYTRNPLDRERESSYQVVVQVSNGGAEPLSDEITISVLVDDVVDYPPMFMKVAYSSLITEATPTDTVLVTVQATSLDANPSILYDITRGGNSSLFNLRQDTGEIVSVTNLDPITHAGVYTLHITAQHQHLSESVPVIITIMKDDGIPRLQPLNIYFNIYESHLSEFNHLGRVQISQRKTNLNYTFSLRHSDYNVRRYFKISESTGDISTLQNVFTGYYSLNVTVNSATGVGHGLVEVFVRVISNSTLTNSVVATFVGVREATFVSLQMERFASFLTESIPCSRERIELFAVATVGEEQVQLVFAIQSVVSSSVYINSNSIVNAIRANAHRAQPTILPTALDTDLCASEPCPHLQVCQPVIDLVRFSPFVPYRILTIGQVIFTTQPFTRGHACVCPKGYSRDDLCASVVDLCNPSPCLFGGVCVDNVDDYYCNCPSGTGGKNCSTICTSTSCDLCSPNPCLHGGVCNALEQNPAQHICSSCPWGSKYSGPNCQLTTLSFRQGSFVSFSQVRFSADLKISLRFATVAASGLLIYSGRDGGYHDYVAVELVIGQIQVGVSFGDVPIIVHTESLWQLNNGEWHEVEIELRSRLLTVHVSDCASQTSHLQGAEESCVLTAELQGERRTLDLTTPFYIGGLESHIQKSEFVYSTSYTGCIGSVLLGGTLLDFTSPLRSQGVSRGCDPLDVECTVSSCPSGECVSVWNGTVCSCGGEVPLCQPGNSERALQLVPGFVHLDFMTSTATVKHFSLAFRTRNSNAVLVQFGMAGSLEVTHGSLQFKKYHSSMLMRIAMADGHINDGYWHHVVLTLETTFTELSIDDGRIVTRALERGIIQTQSITLGAAEPALSSSRFNGCLGNLVINSQRPLTNGLESSVLGYNITHVGVTSGCGYGVLCESAECSENSVCVPDWLDYTCQCDWSSQYRVVGGECVNPCEPTPCKDGRTCSLTPISSTIPFQCVCERGDCDGQQRGTCSAGFHGPPLCQPCRCSPRGTTEDVCDSSTGACLCNADGDYYSMSGDLGCQSCDCHAIGSVSSKCDQNTGQCECKLNVIGRTCDQCATGYSGLDDQGCKESTNVFGSFSLVREYCGLFEEDLQSRVYFDLTNGLASALNQELYSFGLPGMFESSVSLVNRSGVIGVEYQLSNYFPRGSAYLPRPSIHNTLASAMQVIVQTGWVGHYQIIRDSHSIPGPCAQKLLSECTGCPEGTVQDGIICRAVGVCVGGDDRDRDGIPDTCDNCTLTFNPDNNLLACTLIEGMCPTEVASGVLWTMTFQGTSDSKPCSIPSIGYATRDCEEGGVWKETDMLSCLSLEGQQLLRQANSIILGELPSLEQLARTLSTLVTLTEDHTHQLSGSDVQSAGKLLSQLTTVLRGFQLLSSRNGSILLSRDGSTGHGVLRSLLQNHTLIASNLLDPLLSPHWLTPVPEVTFSATDFMASLEQLAAVGGRILEPTTSLVKQQLLVTSGGGAQGLDLQLGDKSAHVYLPDDLATPTSMVTMAMISNLGSWLPKMYILNTSGINYTVATPLLSIQAVDGETGSEITHLTTPIIISLPYRDKLTRPEGISQARCVSWTYSGRGWTEDGCLPTDINHTHTTCTCSHLTVFSVLLPGASLEPLPSSLPLHTPEIFTYVVLGVVCVLLAVTFVVVACLPSIHTLQTVVHLNFLVAHFATIVIFLVGINRVEIPGVCVALGILLIFLLLSCLCWLVADALTIARFLLSPPPKRNFVVYLIIVGWLLPLLLCGIPLGILGVVSESFVEDLGHPNYCWLTPKVVYVFVAPGALLILLYIVGILFSFVKLYKMKSGKYATRVGVVMNQHKVRMALLISMTTAALLVVTWVLGLLAIYLEKFLEYPFAVVYTMLAVFLFLILCLNSQVREACKAKLSGDYDISSLESTINSSSLADRLNHTRNYPDTNVHHHHHHFHTVVATPHSHGHLHHGDTPHPHGGHHHYKPNTEHRQRRDFTEAQRGFHNELSVSSVPQHPIPMLQYAEISGQAVAPPTAADSLVEALGVDDDKKESGAWFEFPDPTPLSPLTLSSEHVSVAQAVAPEPVYSIIKKSHDRRRESHDQCIGSYDHNGTSHDQVPSNDAEDQVTLTTDIDQVPSLSLTDTHQDGCDIRGDSPQSYIEYTREGVATELLSVNKEDPLWYHPAPVNSGRTAPLPYEVSLRSSTSPLDPALSPVTASAEQLINDPCDQLIPNQRSLSDDPLATPSVQTLDLGVVSSKQWFSEQSPGAKSVSHTHSPQAHTTPPGSNQLLFARHEQILRSPLHTIHLHLSESDLDASNVGVSDVSSLVTSCPTSSLQSQVGHGEKYPGDRGKKLAGVGGACDSRPSTSSNEEGKYHSHGPQPLNDLSGSHVIRHADGSETVESLV